MRCIARKCFCRFFIQNKVIYIQPNFSFIPLAAGGRIFNDDFKCKNVQLPKNSHFTQIK